MSKQRIQSLLRKVRTHNARSKKLVDVYKYLGVLKLEKDPVELQREWRDEW